MTVFLNDKIFCRFLNKIFIPANNFHRFVTQYKTDINQSDYICDKYRDMLHKTKGIVLYSFDYNDRYKITHIYTEAFGRVSYLVSKSSGKKQRLPASLFHPLALLEMEVEHQNLREIQKIKEAKSAFVFSSILFDPVKIPLVMFLSEFMYKILKDEQPNPSLFNFVYQSLEILDLKEEGFANFHLVFMMHLSSFLGFYPNAEDYNDGMFFDMQHGVFTRFKPNHPHFLSPDDSKIFRLLLRMNYENMDAFTFNRQQRVNIIHRILEYYRVHFSSLVELKSLEVLQTLFD